MGSYPEGHNTDPNAGPVTPKPTTQSVSNGLCVCNWFTDNLISSQGVEPERTPYNSPRNGLQLAKFRSGKRKRCSTERGERWSKSPIFVCFCPIDTDLLLAVATFNRAEGIRKKSNRSRKVNGARRAHSQDSQRTDNDSQGPAPVRSHPEPTCPQSDPQSMQARPKPGPLPERKRRGRYRKVHDVSQLPAPGSTDHKPEPPANPTCTCTDRRIYALTNFGVDGRGCSTPALLAKISFAQVEQLTQAGPPRQPPLVLFVSRNLIKAVTNTKLGKSTRSLDSLFKLATDGIASRRARSPRTLVGRSDDWAHQKYPASLPSEHVSTRPREATPTPCLRRRTNRLVAPLSGCLADSTVHCSHNAPTRPRLCTRSSPTPSLGQQLVYLACKHANDRARNSSLAFHSRDGVAL